MKIVRFLSARKIKRKVKELAFRINQNYRGKEILLLGVLQGACIFMADLLREIKVPVQIDFIRARSYGESTKPLQEVEIFLPPKDSLKGKNILVIEDIIDSGFTLKKIKEALRRQNPSSLRVCCLLSKPSRRKVEVKIDYLGFIVPDKFVVGYGLDYRGKYRNLPYIGFLER